MNYQIYRCRFCGVVFETETDDDHIGASMILWRAEKSGHLPVTEHHCRVNIVGVGELIGIRTGVDNG